MSAASRTPVVGFGVESLWGVWRTDCRLADAIDVRAMAAGDGPDAAVLLVADLSLLWPSVAIDLRARVAEALGLDVQAVGIFTTQNHGVPTEAVEPANIDAAAERFIAAARKAMEVRRPARIALVTAHPTPPLTFCRRVRVEGVGTFTYWFGCRIDADGRGDCSDLIAAALADLAAGRPYQRRCLDLPEDGGPRIESPLPLKRPVPLGPADDDLLQALLFLAPDGTPIGSLVRAAIHPVTANRRAAGRHSGDYPVYVRRRMEAGFGGTSLFLPGPCGDQAPLVVRKSLRRAEQLGGQIAQAVLDAAAAAAWQEDWSVAVRSPVVDLPIRQDYPATLDAARTTTDTLAARLARAAREGRPLGELKALSDAWEKPFYAAQGLHRAWTGVDAIGRAGRTLAHPLFILRLGPAVIAGLPGEPFGGYSARMRAETIGDRLIVAEECNGYLSYLPTAAEFDRGGYGANASLLDRTAEDRLAEAVARAVGDSAMA
ncbi:MAG: hypothetical protein GX591_19150 [Planctomycetes bacterium]|nr:hypothetical protein [Planctomycetota bacterium]